MSTDLWSFAREICNMRGMGDVQRALKVTVVLFIASCGSAPAPAVTDLSPVVVSDFSSEAPVIDMNGDMSIYPCRPLPITPGVYYEQVAYMLNVGTGGAPTFFSSSGLVRVGVNELIVRPGDPLVSLSQFQCTFTEKNVDPLDCTAPCCPGQATSPIVYVTKGGWTGWTSGTCSFSTTANATYSASVVNVGTTFIR